MPPYPATFQHWLDTTPIPISGISRSLNSLFAFSAIGATEGFVRFQGKANVVVTGRVYHRLFDLSEGEHSMRWFLYDETARTQKAIDRQLPLDAMDQIRNLLESVNPYVSTLRYALGEAGPDANPLAVELQHRPAGGELAAIINTHNLSVVDTRKIVFFRRGGRQPQFVDILSRQYEPLQYPLFFPHGTPGWGRSMTSRSGISGQLNWDPDMPGDDSCPYTQIEWYRGLLLTEPRFLTFGRLTCEYVVDMYSRTEDDRLNYLRMARTIQSSGFENRPHQPTADLIRNKIPASFMGSRAWASDQVADALALARDLGNPTFFITMTSNPKWPEIADQVKPGQHFTDLPTVVCRAFHVRLAYLKLFMRQHFGTVVYMVTVVEFQKRGLPHSHILIKVSIV